MDVQSPAAISEADRERIALRYPPPTRRWPQVLAGLVLVGALLVWGVWAGWLKSQPGVHGQLYSYQVITETRVDVQVDVHRPDPGKPATCVVQAQAPSGETVGELQLQVPPSPDTDQRLSATVKTYLRAHTAILTGCTLS